MKIRFFIAYSVLLSSIVYGYANHIALSKTIYKTVVVRETKAVQIYKTSSQESINSGEVNCLAQNIFFEARNQSFAGKMMVGLVTIERSRNPHFPNSICGVVYQGKTWHGKYIKNQCQFSWVCDGKTNKINTYNSIENHAWEQCMVIATMLLKRPVMNSIDSNSLVNYHATYAKPAWAKSRKFARVMQVGDHIFYEEVAAL